MSNQEQLHSAMAKTEWHEAAQEMRANGWELKDWAADHAAVLVSRVVNGNCTVEELRAGVRWVNALDAETVKLGVDINLKGADGTEALARRIAHHAGRSALRAIGSKRKLWNERAIHVAKKA